MFERSSIDEYAIIVHMDIPGLTSSEDFLEFKELVISAGLLPIAEVKGSKLRPEAKYFVGLGKAEEIQAHVQKHHAEVVIFNHSLTPAQERNLEIFLQCRVVDRTGLILDVFAKRAHSHEGKLQVELAQLNHLSTRLVRGWTHLERQKGGIGLRGPGETQLETDRRLLKKRVDTIKERLSKVHAQRALRRQLRTKIEVASISLVGYTNVGKSSLFNLLTEGKVYVANQLFATLDPSYKKLDLPYFGDAILIDTVGFIRSLPHHLIEAFKATLEETRCADLLLHVIDTHSEEREYQRQEVYSVLKQIGAQPVPVLEVYNKIDLTPNPEPRIEYDVHGVPKAVYICAFTGDGLTLLTQAISDCLTQHQYSGEFCLFAQETKVRAQLYAARAVVHENVDENGHYHLQLKSPYALLQKIFMR